MADPDRLAELQRQRALIAAHLAWLDAEIARASGRAPAPVRPLAASATGTRPTAASPRGAPPEPEPADVLTEEERQPPPSKVGCWLTFSALLVLGAAAALVGIYLAYGGAE